MRQRTESAFEEKNDTVDDKGKDQSINKYEGKRMIVESDGVNYHCGECYLNPGFAKRFVGKEVVLVNVQQNGNWKTKSIYPYYAEIS